jgi:hypothetical protein
MYVYANTSVGCTGMSNLTISLQRFCEHLQVKHSSRQLKHAALRVGDVYARDALQEWEDLVASGAAALAALQQAFVDLQPNSGPRETPRILEKLSELVSRHS